MSLRQVVRSCTNVLSMTFVRQPSHLPTVGKKCQSSTSYTCRRSSSNVPKNPNPNESSTKPKASPKAAVKGKETASAAELTDAEKGDTYISGEVYYSFNAFSFYEIENQMSSHRLPQPNSGEKMKIFCLDKLNQTPKRKKIENRRLLPEEYGYLLEWPGKDQIIEESPVRYVIENNYDRRPGAMKNNLNYRIPL